MLGTYRKVLVISGLVLCLFSIVSAKYSGGSGEPNDPYQIADTNDLLLLAADTNDYNDCFILINDINMAGQVFTKAIIAADIISDIGFQGTAFMGTFDGNDHKITHFTINGTANSHIGLFGQIYTGGSVKNLGLDNFSISGDDYVGSMAGSNNGGSINNCCSTGVVSGYSYVGGLVGVNVSDISNCYSTGSVSGYSCVGGLAGMNTSGTISNCYSTGAVSASSYSYYIGGLVGYNDGDGSISNCYSTGAISGSSSVGGLVGENRGGTITNCYVTGTVTGNRYIGGLAGYSVDDYNDAVITGCYATGTVTGSGSYVGGLVGSNSSRNISNCHSTSLVIGNQYVGGLVGYNDYAYNDTVITGCYATGTVTGSGNDVGGLVGWNRSQMQPADYRSIITDCYATGAVSGSRDVGGLIGYNDNYDFNSSLDTCYATGKVTGNRNVGGLVGYHLRGAITDCYATGAVDGNVSSGSPIEIGGLVGHGINITNCYATGAVTVCGNISDGYIGGLAGRGYSVTNSYAIGVVTVSGNISNCYIGGFAGGGFHVTNSYATGVAKLSGNISNCYIGGFAGQGDTFITSFWDVNSSGLSDGVGCLEPDPSGVTGKTTAEMKTLSTFTSAGWDFDYTDGDGADWFIQIEEYPILVWQISPADIYTDGKNNFRDFAVFAQYWMREDCAIYNDYCDWADLDFNGDVDIDDLIELMSYWLEQGIYN